MGLISLEDLKVYLGLTDDTETPYLTLLADGVEEAFKGLVGWRIEAADYTHYLDGNWTIYLPLLETPVNSVASVYVDANRLFGSETLLASDQYDIRRDRTEGGSLSGLLERYGSVWPGAYMRTRGDLSAQKIPAQKNVKVTYNAGYTLIPQDIQLALYEACKRLRLMRHTMGPIQSEGLGEYNYSLMSPLKFPELMLQIGQMEQVVARYRRLRIR